MEQHSAPPPPHVLALLAFAPVPLRARHDGWTPERQRRYVLALAATGHSGRAAALVGMSPQGACALSRRPGAEGFSRACAAALFLAAERSGAERGDPARNPYGHRDHSDVMKLPLVLSGARPERSRRVEARPELNQKGPAPSPPKGVTRAPDRSNERRHG